MHAERDVLVTVVFPELRERLERLGLAFFDVDLRWGVPQLGVDGERANSWTYCKRWIERIEPFFVCMIGQRYGWVPPAHEISDPGDRDAYTGLSITEMEVRHAVLNGQLQRRSFFYFREPELPAGVAPDRAAVFVDADSTNRFAALKAAIVATSRPVRIYPCRWAGEGFDDLDVFAGMVLEDLWSGVLRDERYVSKDVWRSVLSREPSEDPLYTDEATPVPEAVWQRIVDAAKPIPVDPLDAEAEAMETFAAGLRKGFRGRGHELEALRRFVHDDVEADDSRLRVVRAVPGAGKSALLAKLSERLAGSSHLVLSHYVGATVSSTDVRSVLERLVLELDRHGILQGGEEDSGTDVESLRQKLAARLGQYDKSRHIALLIDGVNQITNGHDLSWLPHQLGPGVRLILTCIDVPADAEGSAASPVVTSLQRRRPAPHWIDLPPLDEHDVREVVTEYLEEYCKELDPIDQDAIASIEQARNPLYLSVMLNELRTMGGQDMHLRVREVIAELPAKCPDTLTLFDWMLTRLEVFGREAAREWWIYLSLGRTGMSSRELRDLLEHTHGNEGGRAGLRLERSVRRYLLRRGQQWDFFHGQLRDAVERRYLPVRSATYHGQLARYFETRWRDRDSHALSELPYHQTHGEMWDALYTTLCDVSFIETKCAAGMTYGLVQDYASAIEALPESREERARVAALEDRLRRYVQDTVHYAHHWSQYRDQSLSDGRHAEPEFAFPVPPSTVRVWNASETRAETDRMVDAPNRLDKIRAFGQFVSAETHHFARFAGRPGFVRQQARSLWSTGPVIRALMRDDGGVDAAVMLLLHTDQREWAPFPTLLKTLGGGEITGDLKVTAVAPDGRRAVSIDRRLLRIWDLTTGRCLEAIPTPFHFYQVAITPDVRRALLTEWGGDEHDVIHVWDLDNRQALRSLRGHAQRINSVAMTPDGRLAVSAYRDETVGVWDLQAGRCLSVLHGHTGAVDSVAISIDGRRAVSGCGEDGSLRVWDLQAGRCERVLPGSRSVKCVTMTPDGRYALSGDRRTLRVWDLRTGECVKALSTPPEITDEYPIEAIAVTPDGQRAVSGNRPLMVWDLVAGQCIKILGGHKQYRQGTVAVTADGRRAVSASTDRTIRVWDVERGYLDTKLDLRNEWVYSIAVSPGDRYAVSGGRDKDVRVWDVNTGACIRTLSGHTSAVSTVVITPDAQQVLSGSWDHTLRLWDLQRGECVGVMRGHDSAVERVAVTPDGSRAVSAGRDTTIHVWDLKSQRLLMTLRGHTARVASLSILPDGRFLISGGHDETIRVWDLETGRCLRKAPAAAQVGWVATTPDGRLALSPGPDRTIAVWNLPDFERARTLRANDSGSTPAVILPDGERALSAGDDGAIRVWELATGRCVATLNGHSRGIFSLAATRDGHRAVSGGIDRTVRVWDLRSGECIALAPTSAEMYSIALTRDRLLCGTWSDLSVFSTTQSLIDGLPRVTRSRVWRYAARSAPGGWSAGLTTQCAWCSSHVEIEDVREASERSRLTCPVCGQVFEIRVAAYGSPFHGAEFEHHEQQRRERATVLNNQGYELYKKGNLHVAIAAYSNAIEADLTFAMAYYNRGLANGAQGEVQSELADYDKAIELDGGYVLAYYNRGIAREEQGDFNGAIADNTKVIELDPKNAKAYHNRAVARTKVGDMDGVVADCTAAIKLNPKYGEAYYNRALARSHKGDLTGAIKDGTKAIKLRSDWAEAYFNRGACHWRLKHYDQTIADFEMAFSLNPELRSRAEGVIEQAREFKRRDQEP